MYKTLGLLLVALVMVLAACGGGGAALSAEEQAKAAEISAELTADTSAENPFADEAAAKCFSEGIVSEFGVARINELDTGAGVDAGFAMMTAAEQEKVADLAFDCIDVRQVIMDSMTAEGLPAEIGECLADGLSDDMLKAAFLAQLSGGEFDPTTDPEFLSVIMSCMTG